jgi:dipeptide/tripeptide permease
MKIIYYYISLLVFIAMLTGFVISQSQATDSMGMGTMLGISAALIVYVVAMSLVGEGPQADERELLHRRVANRVAMITGTVILSIGVLYQLFITHHLDYWLLIALVGINLSKIISLIYLNHKK